MRREVDEQNVDLPEACRPDLSLQSRLRVSSRSPRDVLLVACDVDGNDFFGPGTPMELPQLLQRMGDGVGHVIYDIEGVHLHGNAGRPGCGFLSACKR